MSSTRDYVCDMEKAKANRGIGKRIKEYRLSREWTQEDAGRHFNVSTVTIARLEAGKPCTDLTRAKIENKIKREEQVLNPNQAQAVA